MNPRSNPIFSAALIVFGFWWFFFTLRDFSLSPTEMIKNWAYIGYSMRLWVIGLLIGAGSAAWWIWWKRASASDRLRGRRSNGMVSTLGPVPAPVPAPPRVTSPEQRLPINSPRVQAWISSNRDENAKHVALFLAIWDIYSKHRDWPATTRVGGHGDRRLWQHCLAVAEKALTMAPAWKFEGVHVKMRGRKPKLIIAPSRADFVFNAEDPLIALMALAHDIGKLEAYVRSADGQFTSLESGSARDHDDLGIQHDALGARILARLPEFWQLPPNDRRVLSLVVAHYHHPSHFPVDKHGLSLDDRMTSLLEFLIQADRATGMEEAGLTPEDQDSELTEEATEELYRAFVEVVTEHGRINGIHGDPHKDKGFMIGSKHDGLIVVQELPLRKLLQAKLGVSMEDGDGRYRLTRHLLNVLLDKGLLYTHHNGIDFARYTPMWEVSHRRTKDGGYICTWKPVIIFRPTAAARDLDILISLAEKKARLRIERPMYTHNPNIRDVDSLRAMIAAAFDPEVAASVLSKVRGEEEASEAPVADPGATVSQPPVASMAAAPVQLAQSPEAASATRDAAASAAAPLTADPIADPIGMREPPAGALGPQSAPAGAPALARQRGAPDADPLGGLEDALRQDQCVAPAAAVESIELAADELVGMDARDLPTIGEDGGDAEDQVDLGMDVAARGENAGSFADMFSDFPEAGAAVQVGEPAITAAATGVDASRNVSHLKSPRDAALVAQVKAEFAPLMVDVPGAKAVKDEDAPRGREIGRSEQDKEKLKALQALASGTVQAVGAVKSKGPRNKVTIEALQQLLARGVVKAGGEADGYSWVLTRDLAPHVKQLNLVIAELKLPSRPVAGGETFVGIPRA
ncbi:HD domain-containing protein [Rubrivivax gelatinosus]|uniref:HD domain-containing protein n=1 Tax=Rubrivivax gelatinosus TaxID=28068 RepID=UPI00031E9D00|nr:HD domain-containing protein [Rubrivivax gelatinosus]MBG6083231.1 hypothetical protein [Rubrivivax gelatinosus]